MVFAVVAVVVFLSRLPFLGAGFGRDPDAWRLVRAGMDIESTGHYAASRPPGYPVVEFLYAVFCRFTEDWLFIVAIAGSLGAAYFSLAYRRLGGKDAILTGIAFAFVPIVYISSTNAMDYTWALAFVLAAFYYLIADRLAVAGVLLGLAIGCRATMAAMLLPLGFWILDTRGRGDKGVKRLATFAAPALVVAGVAYVPVLSAYGTQAFQFAEGGRPLSQIVEAMGREVWGGVGLIGLAIMITGISVYPFVRRRIRTSLPPSLVGGHIITWSSVVLIYVVLFLRLPHEAGYLMPVVPFAMLLAARYTARLVFVGVCAILIAAPFVDVGSRTGHAGPLLRDQHTRRVYLTDSMGILEKLTTVGDDHVVVVSGWLSSQLDVMARIGGLSLYSPHVDFRETVTDSMLLEYRRSGVDVYLVPREDLLPDDRTVGRWLAGGAKIMEYGRE